MKLYRKLAETRTKIRDFAISPSIEKEKKLDTIGKAFGHCFIYRLGIFWPKSNSSCRYNNTEIKEHFWIKFHEREDIQLILQ